MAKVYQHCPVCGTVSESAHEWDSLEEFYLAALDDTEFEFEHDRTQANCGGTLTYTLGEP